STMIWKRDEQYFLIVGLSHTLEKANELVTDLEEKQLEVFVKEWVTPALEVQMTSDEEEWIQSFHQLLVNDIKALGNQENSSLDQWEKWLKEVPEQSNSLISFKDSIQPIIEKAKENSQALTHQDLLNIWFQYEMSIGK